MRIAPNLTSVAPVQTIGEVASRSKLGFGDAPSRGDGVEGQSPFIGGTAGVPNGNLTPDALRDALMEIGITADSETLELAEAFARLGLPLNEAVFTEGRALLSRFPKLPAEAYAMAKLLDAPLSAGVLRALQRVVEGAMDKRPLPSDLLDELSLALEGSDDPRQLAKELYALVSRLGRSTEQQLMSAGDTPDSSARAQLRLDPRAQLLGIATSNLASLDRATRAAADAHAGHIEGQQLLNQIALQRFDPPVPLYFAFPYKIGPDQTATAEIQVWTRDEEEEKRRNASGEFDGERLVLQTIIRLTPPRLGLLEFRLSGKQDATLSCEVLAEQTSTLRLLQRHLPGLAYGLSNAGWHIAQESITLAHADGAPPLWYGGASLAQPRSRVDHKI